MAGKYAGLSVYEAFGNDPLYYVDPGGETLKIYWVASGLGMEAFGHVAVALTGRNVLSTFEGDVPGIIQERYYPAGGGTHQMVRPGEIQQKLKDDKGEQSETDLRFQCYV